ncbi:MAG: glycosyltransferase family 4 protein [Geobacteraceae bacterium]
MKLLFLTNLYPPYVVGGAETYLFRLIEALEERGHESIIITTAPFSRRRNPLSTEIERHGLVTIYRIFAPNIYHGGSFARRSSSLKFLWRSFSYVMPVTVTRVIRSIIQNERPDVINTHNLQGFPLTILTMLKKSGVPVIHTIHDYFWLCPRLSLLHRSGNICRVAHEVIPGVESPPKTICSLYRSIQAYLVKNLFSHVVSPSAFALEIHRASGLFTGAPCSVLPLGSTFPIREMSSPKGKKILTMLYIGGLSSLKGVDILLDAFGVLRRDDIRLKIAGSGDLAERCRALSLHDKRVSFHGFVTGDEKEQLFAESDCLILPSVWYDNSPVVIYESFSWGMPVIASQIGGIPELVSDGHNGLLVPPGDVNQLACAMESMVSDRARRAEMSQHALCSARNYAFDRHFDRLLKIMQNVKGNS